MRIKIDYPLDQHVDSQHPLLRKALEDVRPLSNFKVEWMTDAGEQTNYAQIVRTPFRGEDREKWRAFERHLDVIEAALWDGVPECSLSGDIYWATCGGVRHYLGRDPLHADAISLRLLQDCVMFSDHERGEFEFLTELSLVVIPARAIKRRV